MTDSSRLWKKWGKQKFPFLISLVQMSIPLTCRLFSLESITGYFGVSVLLCWNHHPRYRYKYCLLCQRHVPRSHGYLATDRFSCACAMQASTFYQGVCQLLTQFPRMGTGVRWGKGTTILGSEMKFTIFLPLPTAPTLWERTKYWRKWHHPDPL